MKRVLAVAVIICFTILSISTVAVVLIHSNHNCIGETCPVCPALKPGGQLITGFSTALFAGLSLILTFALTNKSVLLNFQFANPVEAKTRMNN
jgi:hypothetical protein